MRVFEGQAWHDKVNFVDENNRFVGYSLRQLCCESAGYCFSTDKLDMDGDWTLESDLEHYSFADEAPWEGVHDDNKLHTSSFRLVADSRPDIWLVLSNVHTGYYAHGFTWDLGRNKGSGSL